MSITDSLLSTTWVAKRKAQVGKALSSITRRASAATRPAPWPHLRAEKQVSDTLFWKKKRERENSLSLLNPWTLFFISNIHRNELSSTAVLVHKTTDSKLYSPSVFLVKHHHLCVGIQLVIYSQQGLYRNGLCSKNFPTSVVNVACSKLNVI